MRNTYKYTKMYSGGEPQFVEGDVFRITIPLTDVATATVGPTPQDLVTSNQVNLVTDQDIDTKILYFCQIAHSKKELCSYLGYKNLTYFTKKYLIPLLDSGKLVMTIPDKPNSRNQKYVTARKA